MSLADYTTNSFNMRLIIVIAGFVYHVSHTKPTPTEIFLFTLLITTCIELYRLKGQEAPPKPPNSRRVRFRK
jgi:hypothetical protein